ncbi:hypothetical protein MNBD_NITROSPINAE02-2080 [hydrothermal vent metagenome]|uniref:DNA gyrase subunit B n=1 Tax=hydrothermal vent metagenome TaxID=652676 RepID=A0A3B1C3T6_9ZZZZ
MSLALRALETLLMISAPFAVYFLFISKGYHSAFLFVVAIMFLIRAPRILKNRRLTKSLAIQVALIGGYIVFGMVYPEIIVVELLPAFINTVLFFLFGYSYLYPPSMVEGFAQVYSERPLAPEEIVHCRRVTLIWMIFFIVDMVAIVYVAFFMTVLDWAILTGVINYAIMGSLFAGEYIYRKIRFRHLMSKGA